jgi:hypothetical protein
MRGHVRPVVNHRRQSIEKTHRTSNIQSSEENNLYSTFSTFTG